jgi:hypothetical protein
VENTSRHEPGYLVRWNVPDERGELGNNVFRVVVAAGEALSFLGEKTKRDPPGEGDFVVMAAGSSRDFEVDLAAYYDIPSQGPVTVRYEAYHKIPGVDAIYLVESEPVVV